MTEPQAPAELPGIASAENGLVVVDGPAGVAVTMLPDAAEETGRRLIAAAAAARAQGRAG